MAFSCTPSGHGARVQLFGPSSYLSISLIGKNFGFFLIFFVLVIVFLAFLLNLSLSFSLSVTLPLSFSWS